MKRNYPFIAALCLIAVAIVACSSNRKQAVNEDGAQEAIPASVVVPAFNADSAYRYVKEQVDFGPRVPNTAAHRACGDYLIGKLKQFGATVHVQEADLVAYDNTILKARNIIGSFNPDNRRRVLLCAHWDSRPYADSERSKKKQREPILGANDGASGVGVLLEMARLMQQQAPAIGVDITPGASARNTGAACPTCRATTPATASCWTWWADGGQPSTAKASPSALPLHR